jgi:hypothetical protein
VLISPTKAEIMVQEETIKINRELKSPEPKKKRRTRRKRTEEEDELDIKVRVAAAEYEYLEEKNRKETD